MRQAVFGAVRYGSSLKYPGMVSYSNEAFKPSTKSDSERVIPLRSTKSKSALNPVREFVDCVDVDRVDVDNVRVDRVVFRNVKKIRS